MLKDLISLGADVHATNPQGMDVLHVAAQGDQPSALYYFIKNFGMDINSKDDKQSTPLHWAAFSANELVLSYILAWAPTWTLKISKG